MGKVVKMPTLGQFTRNPEVKQIPSDSTKVSDVTELFLEIVSLICYVRKLTDTISKIMKKGMTEVMRRSRGWMSLYQK
jgi:hypothetical protein